jgi:hypothetical protein
MPRRPLPSTRRIRSHRRLKLVVVPVGFPPDVAPPPAPLVPGPDDPLLAPAPVVPVPPVDRPPPDSPVSEHAAAIAMTAGMDQPSVRRETDSFGMEGTVATGANTVQSISPAKAGICVHSIWIDSIQFSPRVRKWIDAIHSLRVTLIFEAATDAAGAVG